MTLNQNYSLSVDSKTQRLLQIFEQLTNAIFFLEVILSVYAPCQSQLNWYQGLRFIYWSFYSTGLHNEMQVVVPLCYTRKNIFYVEAWRINWEQAWGKKLLGRLLVQQQILLNHLPASSRVNRLLLGWVLSFNILWALCRHLTSAIVGVEVSLQSPDVSALPSWCQLSVSIWWNCMLPCHLTKRQLFYLWIRP